ncbi:MAG: anti-sigma factor [Pyrinomonadaceae bacterium]
MNELEKEKMLDLLILRATGEITKEELEQLRKLEETFPEFKDDTSYELAAAAINLVDLKIEDQMPAHLQAKILADADKYFSVPETENGTNENNGGEQEEEFQKTFDFKPKRSIWQSLGWVVAALACAVLAVNLFTTYNRPKTEVIQNPPQQITPTPTPSIVEQRLQFLASAKDAAQQTWSDFDPKKPFNVEGDVVWSNAAQKGYMRFRNLPVNDKSKETYQVWIFDETQKNPISAGVFDVNETGEIIVPMDAAITVGKPTMVGITVEKPGGVMVSGLEKVMAVAKFST